MKFAVWSADALMKMIFMRDATRSVTEFTMVMPNGTERVVRRVP